MAGMEQLLMRVEEIIGFRPDGYVLVDLSVFEKLVDTMGGVTFNVPVDMHYEDPSQGLSINLVYQVFVIPFLIRLTSY